MKYCWTFYYFFRAHLYWFQENMFLQKTDILRQQGEGIHEHVYEKSDEYYVCGIFGVIISKVYF